VHDHEFLIVHLHFGAAVFAEEDFIADLHIGWPCLSAFQRFAFAEAMTFPTLASRRRQVRRLARQSMALSPARLTA
jgi:hypothetical protein